MTHSSNAPSCSLVEIKDSPEKPLAAVPWYRNVEIADSYESMINHTWHYHFARQ